MDIPGIIVSALALAADVARMAGDLVTAERVEEVLGERFPEFRTRAEAAAEKARRRLLGLDP